MDVLTSLHTSVAQTFDKAFDEASRDLYAEIISRDSKVEAAEKKAKCAEEARNEFAAEIRQLKHEIGILREELVRSNVDAESPHVTAAQISKLKARFSPQHTLIFGDNDVVCDTALDPENETAKEKYTALYNDFMTLVKATDGLKAQIKRHKRKLTYWRECLDRDNFTLVLDGIPVRFARIQRSVSRSKIQPPTTSYNAKSPPLVDESPEKCDSKLHSKASTPQPDGHFGMPLVRPQNEPAKAYSCLFEPSEASTPESALLALGHEVNSQKASLAAINLQKPHVSKKRSPEPCKPPAIVLLSDDSVICRKSEDSNLLRHEQISSGLGRKSSHQAKSHRVWERNNIRNNADSAEGRDHDISSPHKEAQLTGLPPSLGTTDNNPGASTASSESSGYTVGLPLHRNPNCDRGDEPGLDMRHKMNWGRPLKHAISSIAEDGDEGSRKRPMKDLPRDTLPGTKRSWHPSEDASLSERLHDLLKSPLPPRHLLLQHKSSQAGFCEETHNTPEEPGLAKPVDIDEASKTQSALSQGKVSQMPSRQLELLSDLSPSADDYEDSEMYSVDVPYRDRPLHQLDLRHFKINPSYNNGLDFAYDDVVRKRHERESIQACTRPDCCGQKFSAMARLGGVPTHPEKCPTEDREIIEDFLGEEKSNIDRMTAAEYQNILHEAKASLVAKEYGRHRHHHQRPCTPPGFWRADMPDTQEVEYDHREALKMEREKVKERYRQSMRPGGLWKFADE